MHVVDPIKAPADWGLFSKKSGLILNLKYEDEISKM